MFFQLHFRTAPNQLKIGDGRELTNTKNFTEGFFLILSFSAILELIPEPTWPRLGAKKAEEEAKKRKITENALRRPGDARGCLGVPAWQVAGRARPQRVLGTLLKRKAGPEAPPRQAFRYFTPSFCPPQGGKKAENHLWRLASSGECLTAPGATARQGSGSCATAEVARDAP